MEFQRAGYKFALIDNPLHKHVVAWEVVMRELKSEKAKEKLKDVVSALAGLKVTDRSTDVMFMALQHIASLIRDSLEIMEKNEEATMSSNWGDMVKAALESGWITYFEDTNAGVFKKLTRTINTKLGFVQGVELSREDIDSLTPWVVRWMADEIAGFYNRLLEIPKN